MSTHLQERNIHIEIVLSPAGDLEEICVLCLLTGFTLELSLAISHAGAAHHVTVFHLAIPLFSDAIVVAVVVTPLWMRRRSREKERRKEEESAKETRERR